MEPTTLNHDQRTKSGAQRSSALTAALLIGLMTACPLAAAAEPATLLPKRTTALARADEAQAITPTEAGRRAVKRAGGGRVLDVRPAPGGYEVVVENKGDMRFFQVSDDGIATPQTARSADGEGNPSPPPDEPSPSPTPYKE